MTIASPLSDKAVVGRYIDELQIRLGDLVDVDESIATSIDDLKRLEGKGAKLGIFVATGGTEHVVLEAARRFSPPLLIAHSRFNSLAASLEVLARLREEGFKIRLIPASDTGLRRAVASYAVGLRALDYLRGGVVLLGPPSEWLVASTPPRRLLERLGVRLVTIGLSEVYRRYGSISRHEASSLLARLRSIEVVEPSEEDVLDALRLYMAIRSILDERGVKVFTVRCFDIISRLGTTACLTLAMLNSEGYVAGCEGDVVSLLGLSLARAASGSPGFIGNIAMLGDSEVVLAHCTIPFALLSHYRLRSHFESGMGVGVEGVLRPGIHTVTLFRISRRLNRAHIVVADVMRSGGWSRHQCRTQILLRVPRGFTRKLAEDPLGNHYVMIIGRRVEEAVSFAELLGAEAEVWEK